MRTDIARYTGGIFETNAFFIEPAGILIDAPQGCAEWLAARDARVSLLLLTHGHVDHVLDAARIKREHGCQVGYHPEGTPLLTDPQIFRRLGFGFEIEPVEADLRVEETDAVVLGGIDFGVFYVPGHCPGSVCFLWKDERLLFGGDVLFAGGIGRWDLPGGDGELLVAGIKTKLFPLGDDVVVLPGHGPDTTIGRERQKNPFLA